MNASTALTAKRGLKYVCLFLMPVLAACGAMSSAKDGRVAVTPLAGGQYDIYSVGGVISDRSQILQKWEGAANETCKAGYEMLGEQKSGRSPAGAMSVEGRIRCKQ